MGTAIKHPVRDRVKPILVIFDIRALWRSVMSVRVPGCQKLQMTVWHRMLYSYPYGNSRRQRVNGVRMKADVHGGIGGWVRVGSRWDAVLDWVESSTAQVRLAAQLWPEYSARRHRHFQRQYSLYRAVCLLEDTSRSRFRCACSVQRL